MKRGVNWNSGIDCGPSRHWLHWEQWLCFTEHWLWERHCTRTFDILYLIESLKWQQLRTGSNYPVLQMRKLRLGGLCDLSKVTETVSVRAGFKPRWGWPPKCLSDHCSALLEGDFYCHDWRWFSEGRRGNSWSYDSGTGTVATYLLGSLQGWSLHNLSASSAGGPVVLSVIQQSRTNTRHISSYWPWVRRQSLGPCNLEGTRYPRKSAILQIGKLRPKEVTFEDYMANS